MNTCDSIFIGEGAESLPKERKLTATRLTGRFWSEVGQKSPKAGTAMGKLCQQKVKCRLISQRSHLPPRTFGTRAFFLIVLLYTFTLFSSSAFAEQTTHLEPGMPNPPATPTVVNVGVFIADIVDLDEVNETFELEMILVASWMDPRLSFDPGIEGVERKLFQGPFQFSEVFTAWWPQLVILNEVGSGDLNAVKIEVYPDGKVRYQEQRNVTLETPMALRGFPFDRQVLKAFLVAFGENEKSVRLEVDSSVLGATEEYVEKESQVNIAQWRLENVDLRARSIDYRYYGDREDISQIELNITMARKSGHVVWDVIFPLIILVSMMWTIFWIDIANIGDRLNISFIGILTIVAYQFLVADSLPRISYFTFTDALLLSSFIIMAATVFQSLYVFRLSKAEKDVLAHRIDTLSKWWFPVIYLVAIIVSYLIFVPI